MVVVSLVLFGLTLTHATKNKMDDVSANEHSRHVMLSNNNLLTIMKQQFFSCCQHSSKWQILLCSSSTSANGLASSPPMSCDRNIVDRRPIIPVK